MRHTGDKVLEYVARDDDRTSVSGPQFMRYQCGDSFLDTESYSLVTAGEIRSVEPQVFDLLIFLIENRNRVVTRDELLDKLWKGRIVSDSAINARLKQARKAIGDDGKNQSVIKTIHRRGYQFIAPVTETGTGTDSALIENPASTRNPARLPSIAVLSFTNLSADPNQHYFCDGMGLNIAARLSRIRLLKVLAGHSIEVDGKSFSRLAKDLETGYLLTGSVQREADRVRVNVDLIDGSSGEIRWSERFDRRGEGVMDIQDEIARAITGSLWGYHGTILEAELENLSYKMSSDFNAFDCFLKGIFHKEQYIAEDNLTARNYFEKAVELDPNCAEALAWCAWTHIIDINMGWSEDFEESLALAYAVARRAIEINPGSEYGHGALGQAFICDQKYDKGFAEYDKAMEINPNSPDLMNLKGGELAGYGRHDEGIALIRQSFEYNKRPPGWYYWSLGFAYFAADSHALAIESFEKMDRQNKDTLTYLTASYAIMGNFEDASSRFAELLDLDPQFRIEQIKTTHAALMEDTRLRLINGLQLATGEKKPPEKLRAV
jgi:TolB-like protein/tetratricopeptide (TPR) repeat protein